MPSSEPWPCHASHDPPLSMNSASSCDSVVSVNSGFSEDSMEYLSAEERACLMFLEETIESLEAENDSGISNDEPDFQSHSLSNKMASLGIISQNKPEDPSFHDDPNKALGMDHKPSSTLVPTPLVLANGNGKLLNQTSDSHTPHKRVSWVNEANSSHHPKSGGDVPSQTASTPQPPGAFLDTSDDLMDLPPSFIPEPPVRTSFPNETKAKDSPAKSQVEFGTHLKSEKVASELLPDFIPPPSDFMDEPTQFSPILLPQLPQHSQPQGKPNIHSQPLVQPQQQSHPQANPLPQTQAGPESQTQRNPSVQTQANPSPQAPNLQIPSQPQTKNPPQNQAQQLPQAPSEPPSDPLPDSITIAPPPGFGGQPKVDSHLNTAPTSPRGALSSSELDSLRKKASQKKAPEIVPTAIIRPLPQKSFEQAPLSPDLALATSVDHVDSKSPPAVAPKPKRLPSNILLKSQKEAVPGHSLVAQTDRGKMNPQKVHLEALKKLGLLKGDEPDSPPNFTLPHRVAPPALFNTNAPGEASQLPSTHTEQVAGVDMPGKATVFVPMSPQLDKGRESPLIPRTQSPKPFEIKPASAERSDMGVKSVTLERHNSRAQDRSLEKTSVELSPGQLRRSLPPAAFADSLPSDLQNKNKEAHFRRSLHSSSAPQPTADSQKLPRSYGISVVISPQSMKGEDRKQALKKLGLIRD